MITINTATDIALYHRDIDVAYKLLEDVQNEIDKTSAETDVRDCFGRRVHGLELGVPTGSSSKRLFYVDWRLAKPVIEAHIARLKSELVVLNEKAIIEARGIE